jgi:hypothetical protein
MTPVRTMPDGKLLVERYSSISHPANSYDIIDRRGVVVGVISLPVNQRIVGFGSRSVYTAVIDDLDVERLQRHPWP